MQILHQLPKCTRNYLLTVALLLYPRKNMQDKLMYVLRHINILLEVSIVNKDLPVPPSY